MTDVLRETLEERGRATAWTDVDGLVAAGDRRVRRRRAAAGAATLAVLAAVGVALPYIVSGLDGGADQGQVAVDDPDAAPVSWSTGSVVHVGDREVDLGSLPFGYVLTETGIVWVDQDREVRLTDLDSGSGETIGKTGSEVTRLLVAEGTTAAWYDQGAAQFVVFDTTSKQTVREIPARATRRQYGFAVQPRVRALADGVLWFSVDRQATGVDVATGDVVDVLDVRDSDQPGDARAGHLVLNSSEDTDTVVRVSGGEVGSVPGGGRSFLSPDASMVITETADTNKVWDVATGTEVTPDHGYDFIFAVDWLDTDRFEALGLSEREDSAGNDAPVGDVIVCSVGDGNCEVVSEGAFSTAEMFSVPVGEFTN